MYLIFSYYGNSCLSVCLKLCEKLKGILLASLESFLVIRRKHMMLPFRYHSIGLLVLFVHDPTDIILEFTKLCVAFKSRGGKYHLLPDVISVVGFLSFALAW